MALQRTITSTVCLLLAASAYAGHQHLAEVGALTSYWTCA